LGFETEGFFTEPEDEVGGKLRVITWGLNTLLRYPGKRFQPYVGAGLGLFFAEVVDDIPGPSFSDDWVPGLNLLGGIRGFVTDSIALFFDYKFTYAKFNLRTKIFTLPYGFERTYSTNMIADSVSPWDW